MEKYMFKVQVSLPYDSQEIFIHRLGFKKNYYEQFNESLLQRYNSLRRGLYKTTWIDSEGDVIRIVNEQDFLLFAELKGKRLYVCPVPEAPPSQEIVRTSLILSPNDDNTPANVERSSSESKETQDPMLILSTDKIREIFEKDNLLTRKKQVDSSLNSNDTLAIKQIEVTNDDGKQLELKADKADNTAFVSTTTSSVTSLVENENGNGCTKVNNTSKNADDRQLHIFNDKDFLEENFKVLKNTKIFSIKSSTWKEWTHRNKMQDTRRNRQVGRLLNRSHYVKNVDNTLSTLRNKEKEVYLQLMSDESTKGKISEKTKVTETLKSNISTGNNKNQLVSDTDDLSSALSGLSLQPTTKPLRQTYYFMKCAECGARKVVTDDVSLPNFSGNASASVTGFPSNVDRCTKCGELKRHEEKDKNVNDRRTPPAVVIESNRTLLPSKYKSHSKADEWLVEKTPQLLGTTSIIKYASSSKSIEEPDSTLTTASIPDTILSAIEEVLSSPSKDKVDDDCRQSGIVNNDDGNLHTGTFPTASQINLGMINERSMTFPAGEAISTFSVPPGFRYPLYHPNPKINEAIITMNAMGFDNDGGWLTNLLVSVNGNVVEAIELLHPNRFTSQSRN